MGWHPEQGLHHMGWSGYNEALFLYILAAGSGMENAEESYNSWLSSYKWQTPLRWSFSCGFSSSVWPSVLTGIH